MSDRLFFSLVGLAAALAIAIAMFWPQGLGRRSPGLLGHAVSADSATPTLRPAVAAPSAPARAGAPHP